MCPLLRINQWLGLCSWESWRGYPFDFYQVVAETSTGLQNHAYYFHRLKARRLLARQSTNMQFLTKFNQLLQVWVIGSGFVFGLFGACICSSMGYLERSSVGLFL